MSDYRIDVRGATVLEGMKTGRPIASAQVIVSISLIRYGGNANELKPELLWGPIIMQPTEMYSDILQLVGTVFDRVVLAHQAGEPTQVQFISP